MAQCRSCKKPIRWAKIQPSGRSIPLDPKPRPGGNLVEVPVIDGATGDRYVRYLRKGETVPAGTKRFVTHFTSCPNAKQHRKD